VEKWQGIGHNAITNAMRHGNSFARSFFAEGVQ